MPASGAAGAADVAPGHLHVPQVRWQYPLAAIHDWVHAPNALQAVTRQAWVPTAMRWLKCNTTRLARRRATPTSPLLRAGVVAVSGRDVSACARVVSELCGCQGHTGRP